MFSLPENYLISDRETKNVLKFAFKNDLPSDIFKRRDKIGFNTPQEKWINKNYSFYKEIVLEWSNECNFIRNKEFKNFLQNKNILFKDTNLFWRLINFALWSAYVKNL